MNQLAGIRGARRVRRALALAAVVVAAVAIAAVPSAPRPDLRPDSWVADRIDVIGVARAADGSAPMTAEKPVPSPPPVSAPERPPAPASPPAPPELDTKTPGGAEITIDEKGIRIEKPGEPGRRSRHVTVRGSVDGLDDFDEGMRKAKWIGPLVFFVVGLIFVVPLIAVALIIAYKMRRTRMLNETLVKLAEKGIPPPPEALQAIGGNAAVAAMAAASPGTPPQAQATMVRKGIAWSDLRKGVLLTAFGLGFVLYSLLDDASPNGLGLVLLFVGIGYIVLWFLEDRQARTAGSHPPGTA